MREEFDSLDAALEFLAERYEDESVGEDGYWPTLYPAGLPAWGPHAIVCFRFEPDGPWEFVWSWNGGVVLREEPLIKCWIEEFQSFVVDW